MWASTLAKDTGLGGALSYGVISKTTPKLG